MLLMFAGGVANLVCMAALTAVMVYEKVGPAGNRRCSRSDSLSDVPSESTLELGGFVG